MNSLYYSACEIYKCVFEFARGALPPQGVYVYAEMVSYDASVTIRFAQENNVYLLVTQHKRRDSTWS